MARSEFGDRPSLARPVASFMLAILVGAAVIGPPLLNARWGAASPRRVLVAATAVRPTPSPTPAYLDGNLDVTHVSVSSMPSRNPSVPSQVLATLWVADPSPVIHVHKLFIQLVDDSGLPLTAVVATVGSSGSQPAQCIVSGDKLTFECDPPTTAGPNVYWLSFSLAADTVGDRRQVMQPVVTTHDMEAAPWKGQFYSCGDHDCTIA